MEKFIIPASARTWVNVPAGHDFPIQNLPFVQGERDNGEDVVGVAIGDYILDLVACVNAELIELDDQSSWLNEASHDDEPWDICDLLANPSASDVREVRQIAFDLLQAGNEKLQRHPARDQILLHRNEVSLHSPSFLGAFVDFYSGIHHASNVGKMFRPDQPPLLPNYRHVPIGYNGRASSVVLSGSEIVRPRGILKPAEGDPFFGPTQELDFELEMGFFAGLSTDMGQAIDIHDAEDHIAGMVIVNDWSARDIQRFEYVPLGPFLAKSFATSITAHLVSLDALEPFRIDGMPQEPVPLEHLRNPGPSHFDIQLEVLLKTDRMKEPQVVCRSNTKHLYWSMAQQLTHQASNGTPIESGDLYASGTISGPDAGGEGSMLELSWRGQRPITLTETGETRTFLEDGDTVIMRAWAEGDGYRIGFGECAGTVVEAE